MNTLMALDALITLTNTLAKLSLNAQAISALIAKAHAEGRDHFTAEEWVIITSADDAAREVLKEAIIKK